jgi:hypothetical protein
VSSSSQCASPRRMCMRMAWSGAVSGDFTLALHLQ